MSPIPGMNPDDHVSKFGALKKSKDIITDRKEREKYYDDEVSPLLAKAAEKAAAQNMPLASITEFNPGSTAKTLVGTAHSAGAPMVVAVLGIQSNGDLDKILQPILEGSLKAGHASDVLEAMGIPKVPKNGGKHD